VPIHSGVHVGGSTAHLDGLGAAGVAGPLVFARFKESALPIAAACWSLVLSWRFLIAGLWENYHGFHDSTD